MKFYRKYILAMLVAVPILVQAQTDKFPDPSGFQQVKINNNDVKFEWNHPGSGWKMLNPVTDMWFPYPYEIRFGLSDSGGGGAVYYPENGPDNLNPSTMMCTYGATVVAGQTPKALELVKTIAQPVFAPDEWKKQIHFIKRQIVGLMISIVAFGHMQINFY